MKKLAKLRHSDRFLIACGLLVTVFLFSLLDANFRDKDNSMRLRSMQQQVQNLELTDLALFTEARYTRHLSQSDLHSAFQDHPMAFEHFPSGSLLVPPRGVQ